jgi:MoxR-like ATPase
MSAGLPACIALTTQHWFEECLKRGCTVFHFPPNSNPRGVNRLSSGSVCLILVRPRPRAPREEWVFLGEFTVKNVRLVGGEEFHAYASKAVTVEELPPPKPGESSWIIEFKSLTRYGRPVKLAECDVKTSTSEKPLKDWDITGFTRIKPVDASKVVEYVRNLAGKGGIVTGEREVRISDLEKLLVLHLIAGKNVIVLGPPGSGKTKLVKDLCESLGVKCNIVTGNPEWTPFDTIGGRGVDGAFKPGFITSSIIRCWRSLKGSGRPELLIIDEINRANVDLAFGGLFTRLDVSHRDEPLIEDARGLGVADDVLIDGNLYVPYSFRILATMNSYDRAMLFKLGYALLRRFAVVEMRRNFSFKQNPQGWVENVRNQAKTWKECDLKKSIYPQVIDKELKLSRPQFKDYALLDLTLHNALEKAGGTLGVLGELAEKLGFGGAEELLDVIYGISCRVNVELSEYNVEITEAPVADTIKFITVAALLDREHAQQHLVTLIDEAVSSYMIPQLDILADRVRAERLGLMLEGGKGVKDRVEELSREMGKLGFTRTSTLLKRLAGGGSVL